MTRILAALKQIDERSTDVCAGAQPTAPKQPGPLSEEPVTSADAAAPESEPTDEPVEGLSSTEPSVEPMESERSEHRCRELADNLLDRLGPSHEGVLLFAGPRAQAQDAEPIVALATSLAEQTGGEVLLVDCDAHHPALSASLSGHGETGWAEVLSGSVNWSDAICASGVKGLSLLSAGHVSADAPYREAAVDADGLVRELRREYALVLLLVPQPSDPGLASLVSSVDGVCLVVQLGRTPQRDARRALDAVGRQGGTVLGCIATSR